MFTARWHFYYLITRRIRGMLAHLLKSASAKKDILTTQLCGAVHFSPSDGSAPHNPRSSSDRLLPKEPARAATVLSLGSVRPLSTSTIVFFASPLWTER